MSSNGAVGCPEDMQVESAHESSLRHLDAVVADKPSTNVNNIADISGKHYVAGCFGYAGYYDSFLSLFYLLNLYFSIDPAPASSASPSTQASEGKLFSLKKWNAVAMWSWDVECDTCAICRVQVCKQVKRIYYSLLEIIYSH